MKLITWPYITPQYLQQQGLSPTFVDRFWAKVQITDSHWFWTGSTRPCGKHWTKGHGMIQKREGVNGKIYAHRAAWILCRGPIPDDSQVLHRCPGGDVPYCVNPNHLMLGDPAQNMRHTTADGHNPFSKGFKGERHGMHKVTPEQVMEMRRLRAAGQTLKRVADQFGLSIGAVHAIVSGKTWNHLPLV